MELGIHLLDPDCMPYKATDKSTGVDVRARERVVLHANQIFIMPTGVVIKCPEGYSADVRPRSGLSMRGLTIINSPGTIDADYCGPNDEVKVILQWIPECHQYQDGTPMTLEISKGDRIAQIVLKQDIPIELNKFTPVDKDRGGFGSSGVK